MVLTERTAGETVFGSTRQQSTVGLNTLAGTASGIVLISADGTEFVIWVRNNGDVMTGSRANFTTPQSAGTKIGAQ